MPSGRDAGSPGSWGWEGEGSYSEKRKLDPSLLLTPNKSQTDQKPKHKKENLKIPRENKQV